MKKNIKLSELKNKGKEKSVICEINGEEVKVVIAPPTDEDYVFIGKAIDEKKPFEKVILYILDKMSNIEIDENLKEEFTGVSSLNYVKVIGLVKEVFDGMVKDIKECLDLNRNK